MNSERKLWNRYSIVIYGVTSWRDKPMFDLYSITYLEWHNSHLFAIFIEVFVKGSYWKYKNGYGIHLLSIFIGLFRQYEMQHLTLRYTYKGMLAFKGIYIQ